MGRVGGHPRWAAERPDPDSWRAPRGRPMSAAVAEQDRTAGGAQHRIILLPDGRQATGSVELKCPGGRRVYAYLRYMRDGKTVAAYIGEAPGDSRENRLAAAWDLVRRRGLTRPPE